MNLMQTMGFLIAINTAPWLDKDNVFLERGLPDAPD
jgi:hypothetical protein